MHAASMTSVEVLLNEFYQPTTSNARKREIETNLLAFKSQPEAWQLCLRVATATNSFTENQFLWFFSTSTLEHTITRRWTQLTAADRTLLRETLWQHYAQLMVLNGARRHRDTLAQLIALLGKREFPEQDPNYMQHCMELTKTRFSLGINLLRVTSEEVVSNRGDLTSEWKQYFHSCISMCIPDVLDLLTKYLLIAVCYINGKDIHTTIPSTFMDYSLTAALPNDNQLSSSVLELLSCVQHLVSWIRTDLISEYFLMSIIDLSQWRQANENISLGALSVLNELLYLQKPLPFAFTLMNGVSGLLEQHNSVKHQSEMYSDKFRELLRLYSTKYAGKMMQEPEMLDSFLDQLYRCTTKLHGALDFTEKLDIWTPIIKGIAEQPTQLSAHHGEIMTKLVDEIMRRTQFEINKTELELLDNELMEDDTPTTEWQQFLDQCFECLALLATTRGAHIVFAQVFAHWSRPQTYLLSLELALDHGSGRCYEAARKLKLANVGEILRDFATVCQAVVRLAPLMDTAQAPADVVDEMERQLQVLSERLLQTLQLLASNRVGGSDSEKASFQMDLDNLYAQVLLAIRSIFPMSKSLNSEQLLHRLFAILGSIFAGNASPSAASPIVQQAASEVLLFIATVIRPKCLLDIPEIQSLMQAGPRLGGQLPRQVCINVHISLVSYMVMPWKNVPEQQQDYPRRQWMLREYIGALSRNFQELDLPAAGESKVAATTLSLLGTFTALIDYFKATGATAKDILASTFKPILNKALVIFNSYGLSSIAMAITVAEFSLSMLRTLPMHLGAQFIKEMITLFIDVSSREQLTLSRLAVMEKVLQMFQLVVEQPGSASLSLMPSILGFSTQQILPLLQQQNVATDSSEITSLLFALFDSVLTCKWQFFYKNQLSNGHGNGHANGQQPNNFNCSDNLHPEHFMAIMNAYGQMLVSGTDPSNVRSVLLSMQNVNERSRLYQRALFKEQLLASFQRALLNLLLSGEGALHFDLIAQALFAMGQVDRRQLLESFVNATLPVAQSTLEDICQTTDIPTFTQKLTQLTQDAHCAHLNETT
ncbi:hypothetical protein AWZ03_011754 [Drosophila navojoa]|uniref:Importin N-terminal domain-containing protein n=1 Tax=Drosophila navojoa TaxID=7232 RepID=A0A484B206_DRONA|nr:exportin-6-A [Drosophila navojoa]TDG41825.1 hypothetical protein AWZ03_011754 [Drosophila navojoa]